VSAQTGLQVQAIEQVGPLHQGAMGTARAFDCQVEGQAALTDGDVVDMEYVTLDAFRLLDVGDSAHRRAALDGFTIMGDPDHIGEIDPKYADFAPVEGIFLGDDEFVLIQVGSDEQRTWRRLDM
jgi:hypothetical protein